MFTGILSSIYSNYTMCSCFSYQIHKSFSNFNKILWYIFIRGCNVFKAPHKNVSDRYVALPTFFHFWAKYYAHHIKTPWEAKLSVFCVDFVKLCIGSGGYIIEATEVLLEDCEIIFQETVHIISPEGRVSWGIYKRKYVPTRVPKINLLKINQNCLFWVDILIIFV